MSGVIVPTTSRSTSDGLAPGGLQAARRRPGAEVAGRLVGRGEPPLVDPGAVDDPVGVEAVRGLRRSWLVTTRSGT